MNTESKTFDTVDFQQKTREAIDALTKEMSYDERKRLLNISISRLRERVKKLKGL